MISLEYIPKYPIRDWPLANFASLVSLGYGGECDICKQQSDTLEKLKFTGVDKHLCAVCLDRFAPRIMPQELVELLARYVTYPNADVISVDVDTNNRLQFFGTNVPRELLDLTAS